MVKPFTGTLSGLKKVDGQETVARVFCWFSVVNHRMTAFMFLHTKKVSTLTLINVETSGYHHFGWKQSFNLGEGCKKKQKKTSLFAMRARIVKIVEMLFFQRIVKNADSAPVRANDMIVFNHF